MDYDLMLSMVEDGKLPHITQLVSCSAMGRFTPPDPLISSTIFNTILTGKRPSEHLVLHQREYDTKKKQYHRPSRKHLNSSSLWDKLDSHGITANLINWDTTYPSTSFRNINVVNDRYKRHPKS